MKWMKIDDNGWKWSDTFFFIVIKLYHVIRICLVITFYFFVIRSYLVIKHYLVLKSYLVIKAKEVKLVKEVSHSLWHFACADVVWNNGITVWYCFLRRISFLVWALCQNRVVLFSARNLLFGLGLVSNPSKVGNSYKFCLSAPTTVNTSHAEAERPKTKTSNLESISYTYQPILKKVVRSFFLLQKRIPTLCLLWTGIRLDLKVLSLLLICVCQSNSISLAQKPLPNPATVTKLTPGFIQETKRL